MTSSQSYVHSSSLTQRDFAAQQAYAYFLLLEAVTLRDGLSRPAQASASHRLKQEFQRLLQAEPRYIVPPQDRCLTPAWTVCVCCGSRQRNFSGTLQPAQVGCRHCAKDMQDMVALRTEIAHHYLPTANILNALWYSLPVANQQALNTMYTEVYAETYDEQQW